MTSTSIRNIDVDFPFQPYPCQIAYMKKVIECLQKRENAILESPTGTGKTLCLLCATLSWRNTFVASMQLEQRMCTEIKGDEKFKNKLSNELQNAAGAWDESCGNKGGGSSFEIPKIIYTSRTHSQLGQAIQELKSTIHRPRVSIIGSREQLCIHSDVLKQDNNSAKVHLCRAKVTARTCPFYNNLEANKSHPDFTSNILDIEDLVKLGQKHKVCPYYMARELKNNAEIIFMPYNYMLDQKSRKAHNLDISGSIVVFDEAHNVEKVCEETVSFDLTSFDIASCIQDVELCMEYLANQDENMEMAGEGTNTCEIEPEDVKTLKALFSKLEEEIEKIPLLKESGKSFPASFMFELMAKVGITSTTKGQVLEVLEKITPLLASDTKGLRGKHFALSKFADALQTIFRESVPGSSKEQNASTFKVYVKVEPDSKKKQKNLDIWATSSNIEKKGRTLSYWCFSPGQAMKDLVSQGVRNLILTSGTLSPLSSFTAELQIEFPIRLENPHVIEKHQMWVGVVTKAPDGATLNSSFEFRSTVQYMTGIGNTIANFARTVPNGLLVFFPSYPVMNKCLEHWQTTGIWSRISQHKPMFAEPKGKVDFVQTMEEFYSKINDPNLNGATFFAVCRGKVSEGLDFSDINGRAVVITGLPFPPKMDPKVNLKMEFLDETLRKDKEKEKAKDKKDKKNFKLLSGREWYRQQASRAVNQAIGRVIRHKHDYGAILLCDVRFTYSDAIQQLPSWVRPHVKIFREFGHVQRELIQFFRNADKLVDKKFMKNKHVQERPVATKPATSEGGSCCTTSCASSPTESTMQHTPRHSLRQPSDRRDKLMNKSRTNKEAPVSLARLSVEYDTKPVAMPTKRTKTNLLESLVTSEVAQHSKASTPDPLKSMQTLSDSIVGRRDVTQRQRAKKVLKIVKQKTENVEDKKMAAASKDQKIQAAKEYIIKVRKSLSEENYKKFTRVLTKYKENNELDNLLHGLTPLFTQNSSMYCLFLDFSSYVRDSDDKILFFKSYKKITGQEVPQTYLNGLRTKKRTEPGFELNCKVGKRIKTEDENTSTESSTKERVFITNTVAGTVKLQTNLLDTKTHLNGGEA